MKAEEGKRAILCFYYNILLDMLYPINSNYCRAVFTSAISVYVGQKVVVLEQSFPSSFFEIRFYQVSNVLLYTREKWAKSKEEVRLEFVTRNFVHLRKSP